jgi:hypothetical protein
MKSQAGLAAALIFGLVAACGSGHNQSGHNQSGHNQSGNNQSGHNQPPTGVGQMNLIAQAVLAEVLEDDGRVCLVTVRSAEVTLAGTRSARFVARVDVETPIHGDCSELRELAGYAANDVSPLQAGESYIVAATPSARVAPALALEGQVAVAPGEKAAAIAAHAELIERLGKSL